MIIKLSEWWCMNKSSMSASASLKNPAFGHKNFLLQILFCFILHPFYCCVKSVLLLSKKQKLWSTVGNDLMRQPSQAPGATRWWDLYVGQVTSP